MQTEARTQENGTDTECNQDPTTSSPYVCREDDCYAVLPTPGARRSHDKRDHTRGDA